jgi:hypothetical protein
MKLDYEKFEFVVPDSFYMLTNLFWPFIILLMISLFYFAYQENVSFVTIVTAFLLIAFPLIQWPTVFGWDQYLHASIAIDVTRKNITTSKYITYGLEYPGSFALINSVGSIIGIEYLHLVIILSTVIKVLTLTLIYILSRNLIKGKLAYIALSLFILGNFRFIDYFQFSPQALASTLFLLLLCLCARTISRNELAVMLLLAFSIVITHIFTSILILATFLGLYVVHWSFRTIKKRQFLSLLMLGLILWVSWQVYAAVNISKEGVIHFLNLTKESLSATKLVSAVLTFGRGTYNEILLRYKQVFLLFIAASALVGSIFGFKEKKVRFFVGVLLGAILFSLALVILSEPPSRIWLDRAILLGLVAPTILATYGFTILFKKKKYFVKILSYLCIILIPLSFFANYQYTYMYAVKEWETAPSKILFAHTGSSLDISSDSISLIFFRYLSSSTDRNYIFTGYTLNRFVTDPAGVYEEKGFLTSSLILRSYRQKVDWLYTQGIEPSSWDKLDDTLLTDPYRNRIYDSNCAQIYSNIRRKD